MLSPHEFATLMLVRHAPDQIDMNRAELDALLERQLVMLERTVEGNSRAQLTESGRSYLDAFSPSISSRTTGRHSPGENHPDANAGDSCGVVDHGDVPATGGWPKRAQQRI